MSDRYNSEFPTWSSHFKGATGRSRGTHNFESDDPYRWQNGSRDIGLPIIIVQLAFAA